MKPMYKVVLTKAPSGTVPRTSIASRTAEVLVGIPGIAHGYATCLTRCQASRYAKFRATETNRTRPGSHEYAVEKM